MRATLPLFAIRSTVWVLPVAVFLHGCAMPISTAGTFDCTGLSGSYRDAGQPDGRSLTQFLAGKRPPDGQPTRLEISVEGIRASSGSVTGLLAVDKDFRCSSANRIVLAHQDSSRIHLPPLIDQVKTITYVLTGGPGTDLVLTAQVQTTVAPYGTTLRGPVQEEAIATWRRTAP